MWGDIHVPKEGVPFWGRPYFRESLQNRVVLLRTTRTTVAHTFLVCSVVLACICCFSTVVLYSCGLSTHYTNLRLWLYVLSCNHEHDFAAICSLLARRFCVCPDVLCCQQVLELQPIHTCLRKL